MRIIDISQNIKDKMPVYPNNPKTKIESKFTGHSIISKLSFGTHTGTHVDAPSHVFDAGFTVTDLPLKEFIGPCRVLNMMHIDFGTGIKAEDFKKENIKKGEKIIVKTKNSNRGDALEFFGDYVFLTGNAAKYLAEKEISLFGIDSLSVKQRGSNDNMAHTTLLEKNIIIIEGLVLTNVIAKEYLFVGFPLKLKGLDGSPLRAVLIED